MSGIKKIENQDEVEKLHSLELFFGEDKKINFKSNLFKYIAYTL